MSVFADRRGVAHTAASNFRLHLWWHLARALHHKFGWDAINLVMVPFISVAFFSSFWLNRRGGRSSLEAQPS